jgi:hypothetical protein
MLLASGCVEVEQTALAEAQLLLPADVDLLWDESFNGAEDGIGALVPIDVMVYEGSTGEALEGVFVHLSAADGAVLLPTDDAMFFPDDDCVDCAWDAWRDSYVSIDLDEALASSSFATDADGLARVYIYVDWFSDGDVDDIQANRETEFRSAPILATLGTTEDSFFLHPQ